MKKIFITSSGTEIGKTFVTTNLCTKLLSDGASICALKPVISGWQEGKDGDVYALLDALGLEHSNKNIDKVNLYRLKASLSPDIAAEKEGFEINFTDIIDFCNQDFAADYLLIEGVGGVKVPLTAEKTVTDWIDELKIPTILVVGSYLGSISHTLSAVDSLKSRNIEILAIVVSQSQDSTVNHGDTISSLKNHLNMPIIYIPRTDEMIQKSGFLKLIEIIK